MAERPSKHRTIAVDVDATAPVKRPHVVLPWYLVAGIGGVGVVIGAWLLLAAPAVLGWLTSPNAELSSALDLANRLLLLANGAPVEIGGQRVSLFPLGITVVLLLLGRPLAALAARHAARSGGVPDPSGEVWVDAPAVARKVVVLFTVSQAGATTILATFVAGASAPRVLAGSLLVALVGSLWGTMSAIELHPRAGWPVWLRAVPRALGAAWGVCLTAGAILVALSLYLQRDRIVGITDVLDPGPAGIVILVFLQLAYLPNLVMWATAWSLGAGVTLGDGSLISMGITDVGFLPAIPVLGAIPDPGPVPGVLWLWLLFGVVAGGLAGLVVAMARPSHRFDETTLVGALTGVVAGFGLVALARLASGGLGSQRLASIGVRLGDLAITAPSILGLSGLLAGLTVGLIRRQWPSVEEWQAFRANFTSEPDVIDEETKSHARRDEDAPDDEDEETIRRR
ncbi:DUF6350 family protein [Arachnia propionica]|uniref:Uncharacterized protein n=1 Tax=Arachnia propionica TaxID=1750 RepID=A0A3P1X2I4_9ACTN|nr:DUF6350 family protein [Arachnia propionica]RRD50953.1 hypothetical protein EII35_02580 [Arachnia propionica]